MESFLLCKLENYRLLDLSLIMLYIHLLHALLVLPADTNLWGGAVKKLWGESPPALVVSLSLGPYDLVIRD
jgi:hypothetical protein